VEAGAAVTGRDLREALHGIEQWGELSAERRSWFLRVARAAHPAIAELRKLGASKVRLRYMGQCAVSAGAMMMAGPSSVTVEIDISGGPAPAYSARVSMSRGSRRSIFASEPGDDASICLSLAIARLACALAGDAHTVPGEHAWPPLDNSGVIAALRAMVAQ
jgi:hypothetical protein